MALGLVCAATSSGAELEIDFAAERGEIKPLHGENNASVRVNGRDGQNEFRATVMSVEKLLKGVPYRFAVVPRNCFRRGGEPIRTDDVWRSL